MVDLYLAARLHNRISNKEYKSLLLSQDLDQQEQKLRQSLLRLIGQLTVLKLVPLGWPVTSATQYHVGVNGAQH